MVLHYLSILFDFALKILKLKYIFVTKKAEYEFEEYRYIKAGQRWDIISRSSAPPLNFNEQRFAHFKLSSDLCHQHVRFLKSTMWPEVARKVKLSNKSL